MVGVVAARPHPFQIRHSDSHGKPSETVRPQVCTRLSDLAVCGWMVVVIGMLLGQVASESVVLLNRSG